MHIDGIARFAHNIQRLLCVLALLGVGASRVRAGDLYDAAYYGELDRLKSLLQKYPDSLNLSDGKGIPPPLFGAVWMNHLEVAQYLLSQGANPNVRNPVRQTPLHHAAELNELEMARLLLESGATADVRDTNGATPLSEADSIPLAMLLLAHGSGTDISVYRNVKKLKLLFEHGATLGFHRSYRGHSFTASRMSDAVFSGDTASMRFLLGHGASPDSGGSRGNVANAAERGDTVMLEFLLAHGANARYCDRRGQNALMAMWTPNQHDSLGRARAAEILLAHGVGIGELDSLGTSALSSAAMWGDSLAIELLLAHGASLTDLRPGEMPPLAALASMHSDDTAQLREMEQRALRLAVLFVKRGADVDAVDRHGTSALEKAIDGDWLDYAKFLLDHKADPNVGRGSVAPLHELYRTRNPELWARLLVEHGADPNARTWAGKTPLHIMKLVGSTRSYAALVGVGADERLRDENGLTPAEIVVKPEELAQWARIRRN